MNIYTVVCLEYGDYGTAYSNVEKAVTYFMHEYAKETNCERSKDEIKKHVMKHGFKTFYLPNGETVNINKSRVM